MTDSLRVMLTFVSLTHKFQVVVVASFLGIPVSTTQCQVGGTIGVGLMGGSKNLNPLFVLKVCFLLIFFATPSIMLTLTPGVCVSQGHSRLGGNLPRCVHHQCRSVCFRLLCSIGSGFRLERYLRFTFHPCLRAKIQTIV